MIPAHYAEVVRTFRFRLARILVLRQCLRFTAIWVLIWASTAIVLRAAFLVDRRRLVFGFIGLIVAVAAGAWVALRKSPSLAAARAAIDAQADLGGFLMAAEECDRAGWTPKMEGVESPPSIRWNSGRLWLLWFGSVAFLVAVFLLPNRSFPARQGALQIGGTIGQLREQLAALHRDEIIPPERAEVLEKELDRLGQEASGNDPGKTLESLDHLKESFHKAAADAAEKLVKENAAAGQAEELAAALEKTQGQMDSKSLAEAMKGLAERTQQAMAENKALAENLGEDLKEACQAGHFNSDQLAALSASLARCRAGGLDRLGRLVEARLVDGELLTLVEGEGDPSDLAAALVAASDSDELAAVLNAWQADGLPGRGGISRGRGDAAMTWSEGTQRDDAAFKEKVLPPGMASMKDSRLAGVSAAAPTPAQPSAPARRGALAATPAGGGEASSQVILPQHAKTVQRYFDRGKK